MSRSTILLLTSLFVLLFSFVSAKEKRAKLTEIIIENAEMKLIYNPKKEVIQLFPSIIGVSWFSIFQRNRLPNFYQKLNYFAFKIFLTAILPRHLSNSENTEFSFT
ncbi:MAG: hypothetical protein AAB347_03495 [Bacteroidota bacterium]